MTTPRAPSPDGVPDPAYTLLINKAQEGDRQAAAELLPLVYEQLRRAAQLAMNGERTGHTLQATALVHEVYVRLLGESPGGYAGRAHFYHAAGRAMRQLLIEHARGRARLKRGGAGAAGAEGAAAGLVPLDVADLASEADPGELLALDEGVRHLEEEDPEAAAVVRLRFFAGLTIDQTAEALGMSPRQVDRTWLFARTFLFRVAREDRPAPPSAPPP
ncbi:MAG: ECF-type sigma factor [Phycisphaerales bacterium]